jgi:SulP family sulfate permease
LTVVFDMVVAIGVGVVLAALLFMKRMSELTSSRIFVASDADETRVVPQGVTVYEIAGPLFFGAAQKAMGAVATVDLDTRVVVLALGKVPTIDATGLVALESAVGRLRAAKKLVVIAGPFPEPRRIFEKANLEIEHEHVFLADTLDQGLQLAEELKLLSSDSIRPSGAVPTPI